MRKIQGPGCRGRSCQRQRAGGTGGASDDGSDWTIIGQGRPPIAERVVAVAGDSIVAEAGPYESFVRKGVQVRTREVYRLEQGTLVSAMEGWYATQRGDSVSRRQSEGTRVQ